MGNKRSMNIRKPEVLAPAGDWERFQFALQYGADAIYLGGKQFTMRAAPANFTAEQLAAAVQLAHAKGVKVYLKHPATQCRLTAVPALFARDGRNGH